jgi:hypothetical protein
MMGTVKLSMANKHPLLPLIKINKHLQKIKSLKNLIANLTMMNLT